MSSIPILQLHTDSVKAILNHLELFEIVRLATCSEQMRLKIKSTGKVESFDEVMCDEEMSVMELIQHLRLDTPAPQFHRQVSLSLNLSSKLVFCVFIKTPNRMAHSKSTFLIHVDDGNVVNFHMRTVKGSMDITRMTKTYWKSSFDGFQTLFNFFKETLRLDLDRLSIDRHVDYRLLRRILKFVRFTKSLHISNQYLSNKEFHFILSNIHVIRSMDLDVPMDSSFFYANLQISANSLTIHDAHWFSLDNLLQTESEIIRLYNSSLTNIDLKEYIWQWIIGKTNENLRNLLIEMTDDFDVKRIFNALRECQNEYPRKDRPHYEVCAKDADNLKIIRADGRVACILYPNASKKRTFRMFIMDKYYF